MRYWIERYCPGLGFKRFAGSDGISMNIPTKTPKGWQINQAFGHLPHAIEAAEETRNANSYTRGKPAHWLRVVDDHGNVVWEEGREHSRNPADVWKQTIREHDSSHTTGGTDQMSDVKQPLKIKTSDLVSTLQANLDAEQEKRAEADAAFKKRREEASAAVQTLDADEMLNLVQKYVTNNLDDIVEMVKNSKETDSLKSKDSVPTEKETSLEKFVRVLKLSQDDTIEVTPTDSIYSLL